MYVNGKAVGLSMNATLTDKPAESSFTFAPPPNGNVTLAIRSLCPLPTGIPMLAADFNVCGTAVGTSPSWQCVDSNPGGFSWATPTFDASSWRRRPSD